MLIPNGADKPDWTLPTPGEHPGGGKANPHFSGIGIVRAGMSEQYPRASLRTGMAPTEVCLMSVRNQGSQRRAEARL